MITIGEIEIHRLNESRIWMDSGGVFGLVPRALWSRVVTPDEQSRVPHDHWCLLVRAGGRTIVVDTGQGSKLSEKETGLLSLSRRAGTLTEQLAGLGVAPEEVDLVINTHLHGDHCGGNTHYDEKGEAVPTFAWATYCVQRLELADATFPNERTRGTYFAENFGPLQRSGQLRVLWGDARLTDEIRVVVTPGHTRAHQCVVVESGGQTAVFLGDLASWPIHIERLAWVPAYDVEPMVSIETKRSMARWAIEKKALLIFEHHPEIVAGYLHPTERPDRFRLEPVASLE